MDSDSIYDQHKITALMFDRKNKLRELKQQSHISITKTQMLIWRNIFRFWSSRSENKPQARVKYFNFGVKPKRTLSSVYRKMYNLHVEKNKKTKK